MIAIYYYSFSSLWKYYKRFYRSAIKNKDEQKEFIYENKLLEANRQADAVKHKIQSNFDSTFRTQDAKYTHA